VGFGRGAACGRGELGCRLALGAGWRQARVFGFDALRDFIARAGEAGMLFEAAVSAAVNDPLAVLALVHGCVLGRREKCSVTSLLVDAAGLAAMVAQKGSPARAQGL